MPRYRRINIDGQSLFQTETRRVSAALLPGTVVVIDPATDLFAQANGTTGVRSKFYILDEAAIQGLDVMQAVPQGVSGIGNYVQDDREFAVRMAAGTYTKDQPLTISAAGLVTPLPAAAGTYFVIGYVQEDEPVTLSAPDLIRIRTQLGSLTVA